MPIDSGLIQLVTQQKNARSEANDPLNTITKALGIAHSVYGIKDAMTKADQLKLDKEKAEKNNLLQTDIELAKAGLKIDPSTGKPVDDTESTAYKIKNRKTEVDPNTALLRDLSIEQKQQALADAKRNAETPTAAESTAAGFAVRSKTADQQLNELLKTYNPNENSLTNVKDSLVSGIPFVDRLRSDEKSEYDQIKNNFVSAVLRKESGAVISDSEFNREDKKYFPQGGDSIKTLANKAKLRQQAIASLEAGSGPALKKINTLTAQAPATNELEDAATVQDLARRALIRKQGLSSGLKRNGG